MEAYNIERYFLNTILRLSIGGVFLILLTNVIFFQEDKLSITVSIVVLTACLFSYIIRKKFPQISVLTVTSITLIAMSYQRWVSPETTTTLSVVLIVGFMISVMLKGQIMFIMHGITILILIGVFAIPLEDTMTAGVTYVTLYFVLVFATAKLKYEYDKTQIRLIESNKKLKDSSEEIISQNEELQKAQNKLSILNKDLEKRVNDRTAKIQLQNEILIKYSYTNAHHLRGPVARLLGLASLYKLEAKPDHDFFIKQIEEQSKEIDSVIKQINVDLAEKDLKDNL